MEEEITENEVIVGRKRKSNKSLWKRNVIKVARLKGEEFIDERGNIQQPKTTGEPCSCKRNDCINKIHEDNQVEILNYFYNLKTKDEQDLFLQSLIDVNEIKQRRPRKEENARTNVASFKYFVMVGSSRTQVCFKAFLSLYAISKKRVERLRALKLLGKSPVDKRGSHIKKALSEETKLKVREHIDSFPIKESHYLGKPVHYLDASLCIKTIYRLFKDKHPSESISFTYFFNFFKENYKLSFGRPHFDTCCVCEELQLKLKSPHLNEAAKRCAQADLDVHKRKSKKFYNKIKNDADDKDNKHVLSLCFDFMQNIQLPKIPVQETFYLRQLTVNVFCIHNIKSKKSHIYVYHQGVASKGPNEVCSIILNYLNNVPNEFTELNLYSDNCWGQNKNHCLSKLLTALTELKKINKIDQFYPIRGHSFLPCDRDFSVIKRELNRNDRLYTVDEICELIKKSSKNEKFTVCKIETSDILDFKSWWPGFYKKNCLSEESKGREVPKNNKQYFSISSLMHCSYNAEIPGNVIGRPFIDSIIKHTFAIKIPGRPSLVLPSSKAYVNGKVPLKKAKLDDIKKLNPYIPAEHEAFYAEVYQWPTTEGEGAENND